MATLESIFIKEFKRNMRASQVTKNIYDVPLPKESKNWEVSGSELYAVKGISASAGLYKGLNKTLVKKLPKNVVASKRKVDLVTRDFVRDANNRFVYEDVKIPTGSMVVISKTNLNLPYKYQVDEGGFGYIDYVTNGVTREYMYYIPKKYLYQTHQTALALSVKNMKNYMGMGYLSWKFGTIFLHIIPYKPNQSYVGSKILKTSLGLNYNKEVKGIVDYWIANSIIPNISLCDTDEQGNLVVKETIRGYEEYNSMEELSVGDKEIYGESVDDEGVQEETN